jgi:hypothetical protein
LIFESLNLKKNKRRRRRRREEKRREEKKRKKEDRENLLDLSGFTISIVRVIRVKHGTFHFK